MGLLDSLYKPHDPNLLDFVLGGQDRVDKLRDYQDTAPKRAMANSLYAQIANGFNPAAAPAAADPTPAVAPVANSEGVAADQYDLTQTAPLATFQPIAPAQAVPTSSAPAAPAQSMYERLRKPLAALSMLSGKYTDANAILEPQTDVVNGVVYDKRTAVPGSKIGVNNAVTNGFVYDTQDGKTTGTYLPKLPDGAVPLYDHAGNIVATKLMDGTVQAVQQAAGAQSRGAAEGSAPYDFINTPTPTGAPQVRSKASAAGGVFTGQTPQEAATATAANQATLDLPALKAQTQQALDLIDSIKGNPDKGIKPDPALAYRTGPYAMLPAIPGSAGAAFDAKDAQLHGKLFMEAYAGLKGGGQITEVEGAKATDAIARINRHQSQADYTGGLDELAGVLKSAQTRMENRAAGQTGPAPSRPSLEAEMRRRGLLK